MQAKLASRPGIEFAIQSERLGTGHAVKIAQPLLAGHDGPVVIVAGDSPMLQTRSLQSLLDHFERHQPACLLGTLHKDNPHGLGRVVRDAAGEFTGIVEEKDATDEQRCLTEVNMSTYVFAGPDLLYALDRLKKRQPPARILPHRLPRHLEGRGKTRGSPARPAALRGSQHQHRR